MKNRKAAFSLVEVLLAMSIFSVIALCLYGTFWAGMKLNQRSQGENAIYNQMRTALDLLSRELENTVAYDFAGSYPDLSAFEGEKNTITFLLPSTDGLKAVRYYLESPERGSIHKVIIGKTYARNVRTETEYEEEDIQLRNLVREEWDFSGYISGVTTDKNHTTEIIATNIREDSLKFSYGYLLAAAESGQDKYEWHNEWKEDTLPVMVRIEMSFLLSGPAQRTVTTHKDVFIPQGSWGKPEGS